MATQVEAQFSIQNYSSGYGMEVQVQHSNTGGPHGEPSEFTDAEFQAIGSFFESLVQTKYADTTIVLQQISVSTTGGYMVDLP